jgi:probable rRNA maturation factor
VTETDLDPTDVAAVEITLQNPNGFRAVDVKAIRPWFLAVVAHVAPNGESIAVRFITDDEMKRLNRQFRGRDETTDVLSFPGDEGPARGHLGDIAVSVPTARRQAEFAGHSVTVELQTLLVHGLLHCIGYDHETDEGEMQALELSLRERWVERDA